MDSAGTGQLREFSGTTSHLEVSSAGGLAYEYGGNGMVLAGSEHDLLDMGKHLAICKKINGEWFIIALSFTGDTTAPVRLEVQ